MLALKFDKGPRIYTLQQKSQLKISDTAPRKPRILMELSYSGPKSWLLRVARAIRPDFPGLLGCAFKESASFRDVAPWDLRL